MKKIFTCFFSILSIVSISQNFGMDDDSKYIYKSTASITPPHEYFQFYNFSGDSLPIRWRINEALTFYPSQWGFALQDNETYHNPIIDSNDIVIPVITGSLDKIIINIFHNQQAGYGELVIDLINLDSLEEVYQIKFEIDIYQANSIRENILSQILLYPNPAIDNLTLKIPEATFQNYEIIDPLGRTCIQNELKMNESLIQIPLESLSSGVYHIRIFTDSLEPFTVPFVRQ